MSEPLILGIESSCDETGVGIVRGNDLLANEVASSMEQHVRFGGVVPEVASRAHLEAIVPVLEKATATAGVDLSEVGMSPAQVAQLQKLVDDGTLTDKLARQVIDGVIAGEGDPQQVVDGRGLAVVSDDAALGAAVDDVIAANPQIAEKIRGGKVQAAGALIGQVMKAMRGQADAKRVRELILEKLS